MVAVTTIDDRALLRSAIECGTWRANRGFTVQSIDSAAIEAMMEAYPAWARVVKERLASAGEEGVLRELYDMSCRAAKRYPRDFLERRIRVSITGLAAYHERLERVGTGR